MNPTQNNGNPGGTTFGSSAHGADGGQTAAARSSLSEAGEHLKQAAQLAGDTARSAAEVARGELRSGGRAIGDELHEAANSGKQAASKAGDVATEQWQAALTQGRSLLQSAEQMVLERPLAAVGVAIVAGMLISRMSRR